MLYKYPPKPWVDRGWNHDIRDPILKGVLNIGGMGCARPCSSDYQNPKSTARHVDHRPFVARMHKSSLIKPPSCLPRGWRQVISDYLFSKSICSIERLKSARSLQILGPFLLRRAYKRPVLKAKAAPDPVSQTLAALKDGAAENWPCWRYTVSSMEANGIAWYSDDILPSKNLQYDSHRFTILGKSTPRRRLWTRSPWCLDPAWLLCYETFVVLTLFVKSFGEGFQDLSSIGFPICSFPEMGCLLGSQLTLICLGASRPPLGRPQYDSTVDIEVDRWRGASRCGFPGHPFDGWIGRPEEKMSKHVETCRNQNEKPIISNHHEWSWFGPPEKKNNLDFWYFLVKGCQGYEEGMGMIFLMVFGYVMAATDPSNDTTGKLRWAPHQAPVHCHLQPPLLDKCCGAGVDLQLTWLQHWQWWLA